MAIYQGHNEDSSGNILLSIGNGMTATVETGTKASQAYTKGAYLFFNNRLCKASSAISSGATLTIGTNLTQTSLGAEITSHLRSSDGKEFYFDVKDGTYGYYPSASKTSSEFVPFGGTMPKIRMVMGSSRNSASGSLGASLSINNADFCFSKIKQISGNTISLNGSGMSLNVEYDISSTQTISLSMSGSSVASLSGTFEIW